MIETSQLQTLVAVAKAKSFSKAAGELHVTQSAISQSIKNLEKKLNVKLFMRSGKSVVMTTEGEKLYNMASDFLGTMEDTLEQIRHEKDSMAGTVRIGTLNGIGKSWLVPELLELSKANESLTVAITLGFQENLVRDFENMRLDILVLPEESLPSSGEKKLLAEEMSTIVFPKSFADKIGKDIDLETLSSFPTILFQKEDHLFLKWCRDRFGKNPKNINVRYIVNSHGSMLQAVHDGLGVAVVPKHVLDRSYYKDKIGTLGEDFEVSNGKFYIVYHKESYGLMRIRETLERLTASSNPFANS